MPQLDDFIFPAAAIPPDIGDRLAVLGMRFIELIELLYRWSRENDDALDQLVSRATSRREGSTDAS